MGQRLEPHLAEMMARAEAAKETAVQFLSLNEAGLRLGVMRSVGPVPFVSFFTRFQRRHPGVELTLTEASPERLSALLDNGELDLALMAQSGDFAPPLQRQPLYRERFVIACSVGHAFARRNMVRVAELDGQFYLSRPGCDYRDMLVEICTAHGVKLARRVQSEREDWILTMVAAGMGICLLPEYLQHDFRRDQPAGHRSVNRARGVPGHGGRTALVAASFSLRTGGPAV